MTKDVAARAYGDKMTRKNYLNTMEFIDELAADLRTNWPKMPRTVQAQHRVDDILRQLGVAPTQAPKNKWRGSTNESAESGQDFVFCFLFLFLRRFWSNMKSYDFALTNWNIFAVTHTVKRKKKKNHSKTQTFHPPCVFRGGARSFVVCCYLLFIVVICCLLLLLVGIIVVVVIICCCYL